MFNKLKTLLGDDEEPPLPPNTPTVTETVNHFTDGDYYIGTETVTKGDCSTYTVRSGFAIAGVWDYAPGEEVAGVVRPYDGSVTIEENVRNYIGDTGEIPVDDWTPDPDPNVLLHGIALVPGEYIEEAAADEYLAVPMYEDEGA